MDRPDGFYCFECAYFGGGKMCYKHMTPLLRKGWEPSCDKFVLIAEAEEGTLEKARKEYETKRRYGYV